MTTPVKPREKWWGRYSGDLTVKDTEDIEIVVAPKANYQRAIDGLKAVLDEPCYCSNCHGIAEETLKELGEL
ncbi:MAG: hypothetical protein OM95_07010 [Bdellovibrio sp. ArHS]|uniref:hypothetical protein n=1 Tax=Bdellovibrio sp. ArHS TaxID=1569284 RepID=UPI0005839C71|nr:hypothetical protein [Bdellovibrio sp. ArHS]KHD88859.1 MAG: hypothetical protein OM95_07010 [Bdellovibrio sp. ArHS]